MIARFDEKASILFAVVGIVFGLSLNFLGLFSEIKDDNCLMKSMAIIFASCYFISFVIVIYFLIAVIYPRRKKGGAKNVIYYGDIVNMTNEEFEQGLQTLNKKSDNEFVTNQIKVNSKICNRKHINFVRAVWSLIPMFVFVIALVIVNFII
jgi:hypothetical protein